MAQPLQVGMPDSLYLWGDCIIRVAARNPTTGAEVAGVDVSDVTFEVGDVRGDDDAVTAFKLLNPVLLHKT